MSEIDMHIIQAFFNGYIDGFIREVERAIKSQAYYLAALGLSVYTEIMGGLITGNLGIDKHSRRNFERFLFDYMGKAYSDLNRQNNIDIYDILRCGLVHEFFIKRGEGGSSAIALGGSPKSKFGLDLFEDYVDGKINGEKVTHHVLFINEYLSDFKNGIDKYREQLLINCNPELLGNFMKALRNISR